VGLEAQWQGLLMHFRHSFNSSFGVGIKKICRFQTWHMLLLYQHDVESWACLGHLYFYKHIGAKLLILELGPMYSSYLLSQSYELCLDDLI